MNQHVYRPVTAAMRPCGCLPGTERAYLQAGLERRGRMDADACAGSGASATEVPAQNLQPTTLHPYFLAPPCHSFCQTHSHSSGCDGLQPACTPPARWVRRLAPPCCLQPFQNAGNAGWQHCPALSMCCPCEALDLPASLPTCCRPALHAPLPSPLPSPF